MTRTQQATARRSTSQEMRKFVSTQNPSVSRLPVESLLRDIALVLHATATIRRSMDAEQTPCSAVS